MMRGTLKSPFPLRLILFTLAYWMGAELSYALLAKAGNFSAFWPPAGIYLGMLLATPRRRWWAVILAAAAPNLFSDLVVHGQPFWRSGGFMLVNGGAPLAAAGLLVRLCRPVFSFARLAHVVNWVLITTFISTPLGAAGGALLVVNAQGGSFSQKWFQWWVGDLLGVLALTPLAHQLLTTQSWPHRMRALEAALLLSSLSAATVLIFREPDAHALPPVVLFFFLLWAALRFGAALVSAAATVLAVIALWLTGAGFGPYMFKALPQTRALMAQVMAATGALLFYLLTAVMAERRAAEKDLQQTNANLDEQVKVRTAELLHANEQLRGNEITLQQALDASQKAEEALREADRRKDEFLALLGHELRNPIAAMLNAHRVAAGRHDDATTARTQEILDRQIKHMSRLVDDLLDVSRITHGKVSLRREPVDLARLVRDTCDDVRNQIEHSGLTLALECEGEGVPILWVDGDRTRLAQMLSNLVTNAIKFTDAGGRISVWTGRDADGRAVVTVRDTGIGIESQMLPRVFDTFAQADSSLDRSRGGLGLGLVLVKGLAELHGGDVTAQSDGAGRGSAFTLRLPLLEENTETRMESETQIKRDAAPLSAAPSSLRVLVIDDIQDSADMACLMLRLYGHETMAVYSGRQGLAAVERLHPDAVYCDIGLPEMNGYEVARELRRRGYAGLLIAVSGYGQEEDRRLSREAGFDAHVVKPVEPEYLDKALRETDRCSIEAIEVFQAR